MYNKYTEIPAFFIRCKKNNLKEKAFPNYIEKTPV